MPFWCMHIIPVLMTYPEKYPNDSVMDVFVNDHVVARSSMETLRAT